jgi:hypothetical protein
VCEKLRTKHFRVSDLKDISAHLDPLIRFFERAEKKEEGTGHSFCSCPSEQFPYLATVIVTIRVKGSVFRILRHS